MKGVYKPLDVRYSAKSRDLITRCLEKDPSDRPDADEIMSGLDEYRYNLGSDITHRKSSILL